MKMKMLVKGPRPLGVPVAAVVVADPEAGVLSALAHPDPYPAEDAKMRTLMEKHLAEIKVAEDLVVEEVVTVAVVVVDMEAAAAEEAAHAGPLPGDHPAPIPMANTTVSRDFD